MGDITEGLSSYFYTVYILEQSKLSFWIFPAFPFGAVHLFHGLAFVNHFKADNVLNICWILKANFMYIFLSDVMNLKNISIFALHGL